MLLLMLSIFLLTGSQVQSMSWRYTYDFVVEGGSLTVTADKSVINPAELSYSLIFECPTTCPESLKTLVTVADNSGRGFIIKTTDNTVVEPLSVIVVVVSNKTAGNKELQRLRFTFIDNDGPEETSRTEGSMSPIFFAIEHPSNMPNTIYTIVDVLDQNFRHQWSYEPLQVEFQANEAGTKRIKIQAKEDNVIEGDQRSVLVIKRMSTCEGVARYYTHYIVKVQDGDVQGMLSEWTDWTECSRPHCDQSRTRTCQLPHGVPSGNPVCVGGERQIRPCHCQ